MIEILTSLLTAVVGILPDSPFQTLYEFKNQFDFLPYLNWFVPFDNALSITRVWVSAIFAYYLYDTVSDFINRVIMDKLV